MGAFLLTGWRWLLSMKGFLWCRLQRTIKLLTCYTSAPLKDKTGYRQVCVFLLSVRMNVFLWTTHQPLQVTAFSLSKLLCLPVVSICFWSVLFLCSFCWKKKKKKKIRLIFFILWWVKQKMFLQSYKVSSVWQPSFFFHASVSAQRHLQLYLTGSLNIEDIFGNLKKISI